jgi:hypothetical protein
MKLSMDERRALRSPRCSPRAQSCSCSTSRSGGSYAEAHDESQLLVDFRSELAASATTTSPPQPPFLRGEPPAGARDGREGVLHGGS